jgi:L-amino acid N-acyltransferase YncA
MIIRLARETDLPGMLEISNWAIEHTSANFNVELETLEEWRRGWRGSRDRYPWLVAEEGGAVLGFAKASAYKGRCAYGWTPEVTIYVHPRHHGKGTGRRLYAVLLEILRIQGYNNAVAASGSTPPWGSVTSGRLPGRAGSSAGGTTWDTGSFCCTNPTGRPVRSCPSNKHGGSGRRRPAAEPQPNPRCGS